MKPPLEFSKKSNDLQSLLFVVYTEWKDKLRIISARLATAAERSLYYDYHGTI